MANLSGIYIDTDRNGNKIVRVRFANGVRGFSIQTNGNLPETHRLEMGRVKSIENINIVSEIMLYVKDHGTESQRKKLWTKFGSWI